MSWAAGPHGRRLGSEFERRARGVSSAPACKIWVRGLGHHCTCGLEESSSPGCEENWEGAEETPPHVLRGL